MGLNGDTTHVYDSVLVDQYKTTKYTSRNAYNTFDLSTSIGFVYSSSRWSVFADAGLAYNLAMKANGRMLNESLDVIGFTEPMEGGQSPFRKNLGVGVVANFGVAYEIIPSLKFKLQTGYKRYFRDFSNDGTPINQNYHLINMGMGLQYTFDNF